MSGKLAKNDVVKRFYLVYKFLISSFVLKGSNSLNSNYQLSIWFLFNDVFIWGDVTLDKISV